MFQFLDPSIPPSLIFIVGFLTRLDGKNEFWVNGGGTSCSELLLNGINVLGLRLGVGRFVAGFY
jgi:hypothetical protein